MTTTRPKPDRRDDRRLLVMRAAITGLIAGTTRAIVSWLLDRLGSC